MQQKQDTDGDMSRRHFVFLAASACLAGCQAAGTGGNASRGAGAERVVDAGPAANYAADGVYAAFRDEGFFIIRRDGKLTALSSYCTHRRCKLTAEQDRSFYCPCHGSEFDARGKVTEGPAKRDLPVLVTSVGANSHLLVKVPAA